jgi:hypothetical protein
MHAVLAELHFTFTVLAKSGKADAGTLERLKERFPSLPDEYTELIEEVAELEIQHVRGQYLRIWGPEGCLDQDEGYQISEQIPGQCRSAMTEADR